MEFSVKTNPPEKQRTQCLIVAVFAGRKLSAVAQHIDTQSGGYLSTLLKKGDLEGNLGQTLLLHNVPNTLAERILLVGCGKEKELGLREYQTLCRKMSTALLQTGSVDATFALTELNVKGVDLRWKIRKAVEIIVDTPYIFDEYKSKKTKERRQLRKMTFHISSNSELNTAERAVKEGKAIANSLRLAKNLGNTPPNICTPSYLAKAAESIAAEHSTLSIAILDEKDLASLKMGSFLSVGQGSKNPPRLITLEYRGRKDKQKPIVLVGKGITFDTGGNSIKPAMNMIGMKFDMCGAAAVLAALQAAAELELPLNIIGVIAAAENMPGNMASRPDDVVTSMSGLTIEILNTDAEGRLVLCDALTYCERFEPEVVIDIATLTGACAQTFGAHTSALLGNHDPLITALLNAGQSSLDKCWQLPLWEEYQDALQSGVADIANIGSPPEGGTILAASFLARFTEKYHWAHLDVAGTAFKATGKERGATGRPVPLLVQYLLDRC